jgi:AraC family transcriptional regulator
LLLHLWDEAAARLALGALYADSARDTVALALHTASGQRLPELQMRGGLAPWQKRRATKYLGARLGKSFTLTDRSATPSLSTFHFARMFRAGVGAGPSEYVQERRS